MSSQVRLGFKSVQGWRFYTSGAFLGQEPAVAGATIGVKRLDTDSIGTFSLTLTNVVVGSAIQVETAAGVTIANRTATSSTEAFAIPTYATGSAANDLRIKVRKGSAAPFYQPYETLVTSLVGAQSVYVSQIPD